MDWGMDTTPEFTRSPRRALVPSDLRARVDGALLDEGGVFLEDLVNLDVSSGSPHTTPPPRSAPPTTAPPR